jgi:hypothetical protein
VPKSDLSNVLGSKLIKRRGSFEIDVDEFFGSEKILLMSNAELGRYMSRLCVDFVTGGPIPSESFVGRIIKLPVRQSVPRALRDAVFKRDGYLCQYCFVDHESLECDHVIPVSQGGRTELLNLVTACFPCNRSKGAKTPGEWLQ